MEMRTLLVGLGGTGCRIVDRVAGMIKSVKVPDAHIRCIGLDTDINDIGNIENIEIIPTSKEQTVEEYLKHTPNWRNWFPDSAYIKTHTMLDGAGQMRPLSRLAFIESVSSGRMGKLEQAIKDLQLARGNVEPSNMRVMIVSSFAGGTGSGMFLHTAMWIRKYFREVYRGEVLIRGLFALPDMYMSSTSDPTQKQSKWANAYGSIRELNAINQAALGKNKNIHLNFDGLFDSDVDFGKGQRSMPFDLMFFVDDLNNINRVLPSLSQYEKLMANITYLQVYSPLSRRQYTAEDNRFITIMESGGDAFYGSAGASMLEYPYQDIVNYCGMRATVESISSSWTFFDNEYVKALNENKEQRKANPGVPLLLRSDHYIDLVHKQLRDGEGRFRFIRHQVEDEMNGMTAQRDATYFDGILGLISAQSNNNTRLDTASSECDVNKQSMNDPDEIVNHVAAVQSALKRYREEIDTSVIKDKASLVQSVITDSYASIRSFNGGQYNVYELLKKQDKTVHPLAARLLLYRLRRLVMDELAAAETEMQTCITESNEYDKYDWNRKTKNIIETAITEATRVSELPLVKIYNAQFSNFRNEFMRKARNQRTNLDSYRDCSLKKAVLSEVLKRLDMLIGKFELFFDSLPKIRDHLEADVRALEIAHNGETDLAVYVGASDTAKRKLYRRLNVKTSNEESHQVSDAIFVSLYNETCLQLEYERRKFDDDLTEEERAAKNLKTMEQVFRDNVVTHTTAEVSAENDTILNINVYDALKQDCTPQGDKTKETVRDILASVAQKGMPYLSYNTQQEINLGTQDVRDGNFSHRENYTYSLIFWGLHESTERLILNDHPELNGDVSNFFIVGHDGVTPLKEVQPRFSPYKIEFYHSAYGISLRDIRKFMEIGDEPGVFYRNYQERLNKMIVGDELAITPHLSVKWHLRQNLPYINEEKDTEDDARVADALWMALAYRDIDLQAGSKGGSVFISKLLNATGSPITWDGMRLTANDAYPLFLAIKNDEKSIRKALTAKTDRFASEIKRVKNAGIDAQYFVINLISASKPDQNAATLMCNVADDPEDPSEVFAVLKSSLESLITELCSRVSNDDEEKTDLAAKVKRDIAGASNHSRRSFLFSDWI